MIEAFGAYIKTITALTVFAALVGILLPEGRDRRYAELVLGILVLTTVLSPLLRLFGQTEAFCLRERQMEWQDTYRQDEG